MGAKAYFHIWLTRSPNRAGPRSGQKFGKSENYQFIRFFWELCVYMHRNGLKTVLKLFGDQNLDIGPQTGLIWPQTSSQPDFWPEKAINLTTGDWGVPR